MAQFKNELTLDAKQHNNEMQNAASSVKKYDLQIRSAERDTRLLLAAQRKLMQETAKLRREYQQLGNTIRDSFGNSLGVNLGAFSSKLTIAAAGVGALGAALKYNIQTAAEFEEAMSKLSSITGAVGKDLEFYKQAAIELGSTTTQSAKQVAEAFAIIGSKTPELLKNKEALKEVTKAAITLGEAASMSVEDSATALTGVLNQFKLNANMSTNVINMLAAASKEGAGDINYLNTAIVNCGSVASSMGISVNHTIAILEQLAQAGMDASSAGNNLKNIFLALETSADKNLRPSVVGIEQALENLKNKGLDTTQMVKMFGKENIAAATVIMGTTDKIREMNKAIQGTNTAEEQAKTNTDNLKGSLKNLSSAWEGLNLTINDSSGALKVFIDWCTTAINKVTQLISKYQQLGLMQKEVANGGATQYIPYKDSKGNIVVDVGGKLESVKNRYKGSSRGAGRKEMYRQGVAEFNQLEKEIDKALEMAKKVGGAWSSDKNQSKAMIDALTHQKQQVALARKEFQQYTVDLERNEEQQRTLARQALETANIPTISSSGSSGSRGHSGGSSGGSSSRVEAILKEKTEWEKLLELITLVDEDGKKKITGTLADALTLINNKQDNGIYGRNEIAALFAHDQEYLNKLKSALTDIGNLDTSKMTREQVLELKTDVEYLNAEIEKYTLYTEAQKAQEASTKHWSDTVKKYYKALDDAQQKLGDKDGLLKDLENERWKIYLDFGFNINDALTEKDLQDQISLLMDKDPKFAEALLKNYLKLAATLKTTQTTFKDFDYETLSSIFSGNDEALAQIEAVHNYITSINKDLDGTQTKINTISNALSDAAGYVEHWNGLGNTFEGIAGAIGAAGNALSSFGERSKALIGIIGALNVAQAITALVGSYAKAMAENKSLSIWDWIAGGLAGVAALGAMVSQLKSLNTYSTGGIVEGGTSVGDYNLARLNSGEMVLNAGQLAHLWNLVNGGTTNKSDSNLGGTVKFRIEGKDLVGTLSNYNKLQHRI